MNEWFHSIVALGVYHNALTRAELGVLAESWRTLENVGRLYIAFGKGERMPSINRPLAGDMLQFDLADELAATRDEEILKRSGRTARTLVKESSLRVTLHLVAPDGAIGEHHADGPISVQLLRGSMTFHAAGKDAEMREGDLLVLDAGIVHSIDSREGAAFLLTVVLPGK